MKKSISLYSQNGQNIDVKIVKGLSSRSHSHQYAIFNLTDPIDEIGLIGVEEGDIFAICLDSNLTSRFAYAIYLDGINAIQSYGIKSLSKIPEKNRENYGEHAKFLSEGTGKFFSDCYSQLNGENRQFVFTQKHNAGINEVLIQDPSHANRIEIYVWMETHIIEDDIDYSPIQADELPNNSKIGAGEATYKKFNEGTDLENPSFLGKAMFIHQPAEKLRHLGETIIPTKINDPMNRVPKS